MPAHVVFRVELTFQILQLISLTLRKYLSLLRLIIGLYTTRSHLSFCAIFWRTNIKNRWFCRKFADLARIFIKPLTANTIIKMGAQLWFFCCTKLISKFSYLISSRLGSFSIRGHYIFINPENRLVKLSQFNLWKYFEGIFPQKLPGIFANRNIPTHNTTDLHGYANQTFLENFKLNSSSNYLLKSFSHSINNCFPIRISFIDFLGSEVDYHGSIRFIRNNNQILT